MFRTNGGLIGTRRSPTFSSAQGVWSLVEQALYRRDRLWPSPNPVPDLSPILWYDFADETTVTVSSTQVTQVTDKGSRGWTLTKSATGPAYAVGINGLKCIDWGNPNHSNYLRNTSTTATSIGEVYVVLDGNFGSTFPSYNGLITTNSNNWVATAYANSTRFDNTPGYNLVDQVFVNNSASNTYGGGLLPTINSPSLLRFRKSNGTTFTLTDGIQVGLDRSIGGRGWGGYIGEIIAFTSVLSDNDRSSVQAWLSSKWNLTLV